MTDQKPQRLDKGDKLAIKIVIALIVVFLAMMTACDRACRSPL